MKAENNKPTHLSAQVTDRFSLDVGSVYDRGDRYLIIPPQKAIFEQLCDWLLEQPAPNIGSNNYVLGIGVTALCLRWGTYLSVLMDETKPLDQRVGDESTGFIDDYEMKRINIEASSNISRLLEKMYKDKTAAFDLLRRAYELLPMPQKRVKPDRQHYDYIIETMQDEKVSNYSPEYSELGKIAASHPFRTLGNQIVNYSYRNGPIETIHGGWEFRHSLTNSCCFTKKQISTIMRSTAASISGIMGNTPFWDKSIPKVEQWPQRAAVLPLASRYPDRWSMYKSSSPIILRKESAEKPQFKIISGGQTDAERDAIDVAISLHLDYGGSIPKGRLTEEGPLDPKYDRIIEMDSKSYSDSIDKNVRDSDATIIFTRGKIGRGAALTIRKAEDLNKPCLHIDFPKHKHTNFATEVRKWLDEVKPKTLNVAGSIEPEDHKYDFLVYFTLSNALLDYLYL